MLSMLLVLTVIVVLLALFVWGLFVLFREQRPQTTDSSEPESATCTNGGATHLSSLQYELNSFHADWARVQMMNFGLYSYDPLHDMMYHRSRPDEKPPQPRVSSFAKHMDKFDKRKF